MGPGPVLVEPAIQVRGQVEDGLVVVDERGRLELRPAPAPGDALAEAGEESHEPGTEQDRGKEPLEAVGLDDPGLVEEPAGCEAEEDQPDDEVADVDRVRPAGVGGRHAASCLTSMCPKSS